MVVSASSQKKEPGKPGGELDELIFVSTAKLVVEILHPLPQHTHTHTKCGEFVHDYINRFRNDGSVWYVSLPKCEEALRHVELAIAW